MKLLRYKDLSDKLRKKLFQRSSSDYEVIKREVTPAMMAVKAKSDQAVLEKYRARSIPVTSLAVTAQEFSQAYEEVDPRFLPAFKVASNNLRKVCLEQRRALDSTAVVAEGGVKVWREWRPIETVGIYVPGGRANYPSSLMMCAVPAQVAGVSTLVVCVPPDQSGRVPAEVLVTAAELGIKNVFKIGGPQAVAAMAYGTQTVPKVLKIVGPGNQYVTAAKLLVYPQIAIDLPAGPSENLIIADDSANPSFVAADLLTDAEHGPDSTAILVTPSTALAQAVQQEILRLLKRLPSSKTIQQALDTFGAIIIVESLAEAIVVANEYAPEHMQIMTVDPVAVAAKITNAGSVFIGPWSAKAAGDYATGSNHVLPTGQAAKMYSGLSVDSFGKHVEFQQLTEAGFRSLSSTIEIYAEVENLPAHRLSSTIRKTAL